jgi:hypothetical protein
VIIQVITRPWLIHHVGDKWRCPWFIVWSHA